MSVNESVRPIEPGALIPDEYRDQLLRHRRTAMTAWLKTDRNRWALAFCLAAAVATINGFGWHRAEDRFANNVRVAWVKLSPNGTSSVEFSDEGKPVEFFQATVDSKLTEWVQKRFSRQRNTIGTDFGFASLFMSESMRNEFTTGLDGIGAAKVAVKLQECQLCEQTEVVVRSMQTIDKDVLPGKRAGDLFTTLAFVVERGYGKDGRIASCQNKIITLLWKFRGKEEVASRKNELVFNPLGQEIDRASMRDDPTPVKADDCGK